MGRRAHPRCTDFKSIRVAHAGDMSLAKSASVADCWSRGRWLKTDFVVDRIWEPLLAAEVPFRCLNADMTEQELNLFKLPACLMTQTGAGTTKIVRRNPIQTALRGPGLHDAPDHLRTESARSDSFGLIDRPKDRTR